jgi:hypothetical protein
MSEVDPKETLKAYAINLRSFNLALRRIDPPPSDVFFSSIEGMLLTININ